jgi:ppGpp synthetase/RelA/SpoT-type nucleotidyltranferase
VSVPGLSGNKLQKLGERMAKEGPLSDADQQLLHVMLSHYQQSMVDALNVLEPVVASFNRHNGFNVTVTPRLKNTSTIQEKIRRWKTNLATMEDVAGLRLVDPETTMTRYQQDELCRRIKNTLGPESFKKEVDRRKTPSHGYRAVHLIARINGVPIEIQVRTALQDAWAQVFEKLPKTGAGRSGTANHSLSQTLHLARVLVSRPSMACSS